MEERKLWPFRKMRPLQITILQLTDEARSYPKSDIKNFFVGFTYNGTENVISHVLSNQREVKKAVTVLNKQARKQKHVGWFIIPLAEHGKLNPYHTRFFDEEIHLMEVN